MRLLWRPLKWLWVVLLLGGIGVPLAGDCVTGLLMGKGCTPWKPALGFLDNYGIWVGLVLLALAALTLLARRDDRIYQAHEQSQQQLEEARKKFKLLKPSSQLLPEDLGYQRREPGQPISQDKRPFFDTYIHRIAVPYEHRAERNPQPRYDEDALARSLEEGKGFVLLGPPLNGKSRTLYEVLRKLDSCDVIRPSSEEKVPDEEVFSRLFKDKRVVVLDGRAKAALLRKRLSVT
jgi:hypothetical protein